MAVVFFVLPLCLNRSISASAFVCFNRGSWGSRVSGTNILGVWRLKSLETCELTANCLFVEQRYLQNYDNNTLVIKHSDDSVQTRSDANSFGCLLENSKLYK